MKTSKSKERLEYTSNDKSKIRERTVFTNKTSVSRILPALKLRKIKKDENSRLGGNKSAQLSAKFFEDFDPRFSIRETSKLIDEGKNK